MAAFFLLMAVINAVLFRLTGKTANQPSES
jgi:hypothetical protein